MLTISQLSMCFGVKTLFKDVSLQFNSGNHYGLIGANGCGKSTLIKILTGEVIPENGEVLISKQLKLGCLNQDHYIYKEQLVLEVVLQGKSKLWEAIANKKNLLSKDVFEVRECEELTKCEKIIEELEGYSANGEAAKLLEGLGIQEKWHYRPLKELSGGYKLRILLAQVLFGKPDILILDEPTNHLDLYSIKWLENYLKNFPGTFIVATHDREFLNEICTHIADIDYGTIKIYKGNYDHFQRQKILDRELKEHMLQKQDKRRSELQGFIDRFGAKATKARQAQSRARIIKQLEEEMEELNLMPTSRIYPKLEFVPLRPSGAIVLTVKEITKSYEGKKILDKVSFEIERGERVAVIGPNGIGKSTLLEILNQKLAADQGGGQWGFATRLAYFPQDHSNEIKGSLTLLEWLEQFDQNISQEHLRDLLGRVLFSGDKVNQPINTLSGGEKARLLLAKMMLQKPNVLIFDEPTNHLDMEAIEELLTSLKKFTGTLLFVSHNRYFVTHLANRVIEISYKGVKDFKGTYIEYLEKQENDFLSLKFPLKQRYSSEINLINTKSNSTNHDYSKQKQLKSCLAQLRKKVRQAEENCYQLEKKIQGLEIYMASQEFYQQTPYQEQQKLVQEKLHLEDQLLHALEQWEAANLNLESVLCDSNND